MRSQFVGLFQLFLKKNNKEIKLEARTEPGFKLRGGRISLFKDFKKLKYQY